MTFHWECGRIVPTKSKTMYPFYTIYFVHGDLTWPDSTTMFREPPAKPAPIDELGARQSAKTVGLTPAGRETPLSGDTRLGVI